MILGCIHPKKRFFERNLLQTLLIQFFQNLKSEFYKSGFFIELHEEKHKSLKKNRFFIWKEVQNSED